LKYKTICIRKIVPVIFSFYCSASAFAADYGLDTTPQMLKNSTETLREIISRRVGSTGASEESSLDPFIGEKAAGVGVVARPVGRRPALWGRSGISGDGQQAGSQGSLVVGSDGAIGGGTTLGALGLAETTRRGEIDSANKARTDGGLVGSYMRHAIGNGEAVLFGGMGRFTTDATTAADAGRGATRYGTDRLVWSGAITQAQDLGGLTVTQSAQMARLNSKADLSGEGFGGAAVEVGSFRAALGVELPDGAAKPRVQMYLDRSRLNAPARDFGATAPLTMRQDSVGLSVGMDLQPAPRAAGSLTGSVQSNSAGEARIGLNLAIRY
jgi:hypothetical protein